MKLQLKIALMLTSYPLFAIHFLDIYGDFNQKSHSFIALVTNDILNIEYSLQHLENLNENLSKKQELLAKIKRQLSLLYISFDTLADANTPDLYTTVDIITADNPERLRFISANHPVAATIHDQAIKPDLFKLVREYDRQGLLLQLTQKLNRAPFECPVFYCSWGFNHPLLKPYLKQFNLAAVEDKQSVINLLSHNVEEEQHVGLTILAHVVNPYEIMAVLMPMLAVSDMNLRIKIMQLLLATMVKANIHDSLLMPFIQLLDSPSMHERSNALHLLQHVSDSNTAKNFIVKHGGNKLLRLINLRQPINHFPAYELLKKISGRDFGDQNISAWKRWLFKACQEL
ncbi:MAG: hypothetical protein ACOVQX_03135 [Legionella sp.]